MNGQAAPSPASGRRHFWLSRGGKICRNVCHVTSLRPALRHAFDSAQTLDRQADLVRFVQLARSVGFSRPPDSTPFALHPAEGLAHAILKIDPKEWAASSVGRARRSQRRGRGFESHAVHQSLPMRVSLRLAPHWMLVMHPERRSVGVVRTCDGNSEYCPRVLIQQVPEFFPLGTQVVFGRFLRRDCGWDSFDYSHARFLQGFEFFRIVRHQAHGGHA